MTTSIHASLIAIGRQLRANHLSTLNETLPNELKIIVAQLVALEAGYRASAEQSGNDLQATLVQPGRNRNQPA